MYSSGKNEKSFWVLILMLLGGVVLGGFIGEYVGMLPYMSWLKYGSEFGLPSPVLLDLGVIIMQFGFTIKFSICGIIGILLAVLVYRRI